MIVFRICRSVYAPDLSGMGARMAGGRWNSKGVPLLYTSGSRALAVLEVLVHIPAAMVPRDFVVVSIEIPDDLEVEEMAWKQLKSEVDKHGIQANFARLGNDWVKSVRSPVLKVPSMIVKDEHNFLVNPLHPSSARIRIADQRPFSFDARLF